ncbi:N-acetyllactosaminide beta-1 [Nibea albiflora]|uniref:N-acetyllactosaminide beta-1 n=1 Tax=Nibea albiflora TaxID=240163 RepID=A0ACB7FKJ1_NIBAL|nr:N-acetyllactosaminide beta-1 [Nibea albiflora]
MADVEATKSLSGLLNGIAQKVYYNNSEITEELLKNELYPDLPQEEFKALHEKMKGLVKSIATADMDHAQLEAFLTAQTRRQGGGGVNAEQAAALSRFWKSQRVRVRESLLSQSRWEPSLRGVSWRVDLQTAASRGDAAQSGPVALMELELGRAGQMRRGGNMPVSRRKVSVLCVMVLNVLICVLMGVSWRHNKNDRPKVRKIERFWRPEVVNKAFWNKEQQLLDFIYNPNVNFVLSRDSLIELPDWLNDTGPPNPCEPDYRVFTQISDYNSLPQHGKPFVRLGDGQASLPIGLWLMLFLLGNTSPVDHFPNLLEMLGHEAKIHKDLLQWDYRETFFNLTLKEVLFLEWFNQHCPHAQYILKGDDDVFVNTLLIIDLLEGLPENEAKDLFIGDVISNADPQRDRKLKYYIPESVFEGTYPPYAGGGGYLYSGELALRLYNVSRQVVLYPIDDVFTGMCLRKLGLVPEKHSGFRTFGIDEKYRHNPCIYRSLMLVHSRTPEEMLTIWPWIMHPELDCQ